jgi:hypothetical protein
MKMKISHVLSIILIVILLTGFSQLIPPKPGTSLHSGLHAWVDAPINRTVMNLPVSYDIICHGTDPGGVKALEFRINDKLLSSSMNPDSKQTLFTSTAAWSTNTAGKYVIHCRAQNNSSEWSGYAEAIVFVQEVIPTLIPTITPTVTPLPPVSADITFSSIVSTNGFQYLQRGCTPNPAQVTITAKLSNTTRVKYVFIFFRLESSALGVTTAWNTGLLMTSSGDNKYKRTISWKDVPQLTQIYGSAANLVYQFVAVDDQKNNIARSQRFYNVKLSPC